MSMTATGTAKPFRNPIRQLTSLTASVERRCLVWIAQRLPAWIKPDHMTSLAVGGMIGAGLSYWMASITYLGFFGATLGLAVNWFGDSLDGTLARVRKCERPRFGFYVDHVVDAVGAACLLGGLGLSGYMSPAVALGLLAAYFMLCVEIFLRTCTLGTFRMSFLGIGATELRILLAIAGFVVMQHPTATLFGRTFLLFDIGGVIAAAGLVAMFLMSAASGTRALYRAEPLPRRSPAAPADARAPLVMMGR